MEGPLGVSQPTDFASTAARDVETVNTVCDCSCSGSM